MLLHKFQLIQLSGYWDNHFLIFTLPIFSLWPHPIFGDNGFSFPCQLVSVKKIYSDLLHIFRWKIWPIVFLPYPLESWFETTQIYQTWGCFHRSLTFLGWMFFEKMIYKYLPNIFLCKKNTWPHSPIMTKIYPHQSWLKTKWNLHYKGCFDISLRCPSWLAHERKISKN